MKIIELLIIIIQKTQDLLNRTKCKTKSPVFHTNVYARLIRDVKSMISFLCEKD